MFTKDNTYIYIKKKGMGVIALPKATPIKIICVYADNIIKVGEFKVIRI
jgi:hypothetical protein